MPGEGHQTVYGDGLLAGAKNPYVNDMRLF